MVTKLLYPEVAKHYHIKWNSAEHAIRTVVDIAWEENAAMLDALAQHTLSQKPNASKFIAILTDYIAAQQQA